MLDNAALTPRSQRDRSRCGGNGPISPQDKTFKNLPFLIVFELVFPLVPKNNQNIRCFYILIKTCNFSHRRFKRHRDRKTRLERESGAHLFTFEFKIARDSRHHRLPKIVATLAQKLDFAIFRFKFKTVLRRVRLINTCFFIEF